MRMIHAQICALLVMTALIQSCGPKVTSPKPEDRENKLIWVAGGSFVMGSNHLDAEYSQQPAHVVRISDFYISRYEVTQREYLDIWGSNPSFSQNLDYPVERVSWADAVRYCNIRSNREGLQPIYWLRGSTDPWVWGWSDQVINDSLICNSEANGYRLPTEAEWNWAALGGLISTGYEYSGSNTIADVCWYNGSAGNACHAVGLLQANELGINDMSGNVWEFCWDRFGLYPEGVLIDPTGPETGEFRVIRGGSWLSAPGLCKVDYRSTAAPGYKNLHIGFRVVRSAL